MDPQGAIGGRRGTPTSPTTSRPARRSPGSRRAGRSTGCAGGLGLTLGLGTTGYNVFATGAAGAGKLLVLEEELRRRAATRPAPSDWVYLLDFATPERLAAVALPTGRGPELARDVASAWSRRPGAPPAPRSSPTPTAGDTETCTSGSTGTVRTRAGGTRRSSMVVPRPRRARSRAQRPDPHQGLPDPLRAPA